MVLKKIPFAQAHEAAGACVALCEASDRQLHELSDAEFVAIHAALDAGVRTVLSVQGAINSRTTAGGTAPVLVAAQIATAGQANATQISLITSAQASFAEMMRS